MPADLVLTVRILYQVEGTLVFCTVWCVPPVACSHAVRREDLLRVTNTPCQVSHVAVSLYNLRREFDAKHLMNGEYNPLGKLAVSLDKTTERLLRGIWRDLRIAVEAVLNDWEQSLLNSAVESAVGVNLHIVFIKPRNADLKGLRQCHDVVLATVVIAEFEDTSSPPELVATELDLAGIVVEVVFAVR